eukprot:GHVT01030883.1.p1 GENE.GHVT01030883.1~~GHVT01030883.1.p1  ORF type:complete len:554 (-),score=81.22 GHVT01030883.1:1123-2784(-)
MLFLLPVLVSVAVSASPLLLFCCYARLHTSEYLEQLNQIDKEAESQLQALQAACVAELRETAFRSRQNLRKSILASGHSSATRKRAEALRQRHPGLSPAAASVRARREVEANLGAASSQLGQWKERCTYTKLRFVSRRMELLHQLTRLDNHHYHILLTYGPNQLGDSKFTPDVPKTLKQTEWFAIAQQRVPSLRLAAEVAAALKASASSSDAPGALADATAFNPGEDSDDASIDPSFKGPAYEPPASSPPTVLPLRRKPVGDADCPSSQSRTHSFSSTKPIIRRSSSTNVAKSLVSSEDLSGGPVPCAAPRRKACAPRIVPAAAATHLANTVGKTAGGATAEAMVAENANSEVLAGSNAGVPEPWSDSRRVATLPLVTSGTWAPLSNVSAYAPPLDPVWAGPPCVATQPVGWASAPASQRRLAAAGVAAIAFSRPSLRRDQNSAIPNYTVGGHGGARGSAASVGTETNARRLPRRANSFELSSPAVAPPLYPPSVHAPTTAWRHHHQYSPPQSQQQATSPQAPASQQSNHSAGQSEPSSLWSAVVEFFVPQTK